MSRFIVFIILLCAVKSKIYPLTLVNKQPQTWRSWVRYSFAENPDLGLSTWTFCHHEKEKKDRVKFLTVLGSTASNFNEGRSIVRLVYRIFLHAYFVFLLT